MSCTILFIFPKELSGILMVEYRIYSLLIYITPALFVKSIQQPCYIWPLITTIKSEGTPLIMESSPGFSRFQ